MPDPSNESWNVRVGCDVQSIADVRAAYDAHGDHYLRRVLGDAEHAEVERLVGDDLVARYLSGRFAAKEAVFKVLRGRPEVAIAWPLIEIVADDSGAPQVRLSGDAARRSTEQGIRDISVSISHAEPFAFAVATAVARR